MLDCESPGAQTFKQGIEEFANGSPFNVIASGDSLGSVSAHRFIENIFDEIDESSILVSGFGNGFLNTNVTRTLTGGATNLIAEQYDWLPFRSSNTTGPALLDAAGEIADFRLSSGSASREIRLYYVQQPGAGTFLWEASEFLGGGIWPPFEPIQTVDANGPEQLGILTSIRPNDAHWRHRAVWQSGGEVRILYPAFRRDDVINILSMNAGSLSANRYAQYNQQFMADLIASWEPHMMTWMWDDDAPSMQIFVDSLQSILTNSGTTPLVTGYSMGPTGDATGRDGRQNELLGPLMDQVGWCFQSGYSIAPDHQWLVDRGLQGDGLHLSEDYYDALGERMWEKVNQCL